MMYEGNPDYSKNRVRYPRFLRGPPDGNYFSYREHGSQNPLIHKLYFK